MGDVELLPLPEWAKRDDLGGLVPSEVRAEMRAYTRANLAPLQAENERLRAEVAALQREVGQLHMREKRAEAYAVDKVSETLKAIMARRDAEARAERLAEVLREIAEKSWTGVRPIQIAARATLAQEDRND